MADNATVLRLKRALRPARRRFEYWRKVVLMASFRYAVNILRALRILPKAASASTSPKILIVNLTPHLGDAIMLMPLIEALRKSNPTARIEFAVEEGGAPLLRQMPELDHVYALKLGTTPPITFWQSVHRAFAVTREYWRTMRNVAPTICLLPRWGDDLFRSSILAYLTGAPRRIGFASTVTTPAAYRDKLLSQRIHDGAGMHEPARFCLVAREAGVISAAQIENISEQTIPTLQRIAALTDWPSLRQRLGIDEKPFVIIAPGASMPRRMYPLDRWAQIVDALTAMQFNIVILAGQSDASIARDLWQRNAQRAILVAGTTSLLESTTLISHAALFIGNDSGPGHVAGALGIPSVILFAAVAGADPDGPSSPERIRPIGPHVVCCTPPYSLSPCHGSCLAETAHCITLIEPEDVTRAIATALKTAEATHA